MEAQTPILYSAEIRWFFHGEPPYRFIDFTDGQLSVAEPRTDRYLLFAGCSTVGVKEREGRFEIKALRSEGETLSLEEGVRGKVECWAKWSYGKSPVQSWITALRKEPGGWLKVTKRRVLRRFSVHPDMPIEVEEDAMIHEGCNVELTAINVQDSSWWTFGLEAFGNKDKVRNHLLLTARTFFEHQTPERKLEIINSCGYPAWLNQFDAREYQEEIFCQVE